MLLSSGIVLVLFVIVVSFIVLLCVLQVFTCGVK